MVPSYLFHQACAFGVRHGDLVKVGLGKHGGHADNWHWYVAGQQLDAAGWRGPNLDLLEGLVLGSVARLTHVDVVGRKALGLQFEIILQRKKRANNLQSYAREKPHRLFFLVGAPTLTNMTRHLPRTLLMDTLL